MIQTDTATLMMVTGNIPCVTTVNPFLAYSLMPIKDSANVSAGTVRSWTTLCATAKTLGVRVRRCCCNKPRYSENLFLIFGKKSLE